MRPRRFYLGFPPALAKVSRNGTEYGVGAIPLGGYVKIPGMHRPAASYLDAQLARPGRHTRNLHVAAEGIAPTGTRARDLGGSPGRSRRQPLTADTRRNELKIEIRCHANLSARLDTAGAPPGSRHELVEIAGQLHPCPQARQPRLDRKRRPFHRGTPQPQPFATFERAGIRATLLPALRGTGTSPGRAARTQASCPLDHKDRRISEIGTRMSG